MMIYIVDHVLNRILVNFVMVLISINMVYVKFLQRKFNIVLVMNQMVNVEHVNLVIKY